MKRTGEVGIGVSPSTVLDVKSSGTTSETVAQFGNSNIQGGLQIQTNGNLEWGFNALNSRSLTFSTNQSEAMRLDSSGRVLIGQSASTGSTNANNLVVGSGSGNEGITIFSGADSGSTLAFKDSGANEDGFISYNHPNQFMQFGTNSSERMRIGSDGLVSIKNESTSTLRLDNTDTSLGTNQILGTLEFNQNDPSGDGVGVVAKINALNESSFAGIGALSFHTGSATSISERMRIASDGVVSVNGTITGYGDFNVSGTDARSIIALRSTSGRARLGFFEGGSGRFYIESLDGSNGLKFVDGNASSERMRLDSSGNLGLGTTSPARPLSVNSSQISARFTSSSADSQIEIVDSSGTTVFGSSSGNAIVQAGGSERMRIRSGGVVEVNSQGGTDALERHQTFTMNCTAGNSGVSKAFVTIGAVSYTHLRAHET